MGVEFFRKRIGQKLEELRRERRPFDPEDIRDLATVKTYMIFRLRDIYGEQIGGENNPQDQGQGNAPEAFGRLQGKYGRLRVLNNLLEVANPGLKEKKVLFNQYKAAVFGILEGL